MKKLIFALAILLLRPNVGAAIEVTYPNGGESLTRGAMIEVRWQTPTPTTTIRLSVLKDGKSVHGPVTMFATGTAKGWHASWRVPTTLSTGKGFQIRLEDPKTGKSDLSNAPFTIAGAGINITWPRGGGILYLTSSEVIRWNAHGTSQRLRVLLTKDGRTIHHLTENVDLTGRFSWIVGRPYTIDEHALDPGKGYRIRIETMDRSLYTETDAFTIARPTFTLTYPNGGETFRRDDKCTIRWSSKRLEGGVKIELWQIPAGRAPILTDTIAANTRDDFSFTWTVFPRPRFGTGEIVPTYPGPWVIRIRSANCPEIWDESNRTFQIQLR